MSIAGSVSGFTYHRDNPPSTHVIRRVQEWRFPEQPEVKAVRMNRWV